MFSINFRMCHRTAVFAMTMLLSSCSFVVSNSMEKFGKDFGAAVANHNDPDTVAEGLPTYLLLMDSLASRKTAEPQLISSTAGLYTAYASLFVEDLQRRQRLSGIALNYAEQALCKAENTFCGLTGRPFDEFTTLLGNYDDAHLELVYTLGQAWAMWIQANSTDWNAIAQLAQVKWIMTSVVEKNELVNQGGAHVILAILNTLVPPALGGKPELAKQHFEKAIAIVDARNLSIKVDLAEYYARLVFDKELHDTLLREVLSANPQQEGFILANLLAQKRAKTLLDGSADYF